MERSAPTNLMGTMPVGKLLLRNSVPLMLSLLLNSLYNVVDSIFVSHLSEDALTALSLASPVQGIVSALGCGIAVGLNAAISKAMGQKDHDKVRETASASLMLAVLAWVLIAVLCFLGMKPYFAWQSAGSTAIYEAGTAYLRICMLFSLGQMFQWVLDRFLIATGRSSLFFITLAVAALTNLALDPILIFGLLGFPALGTTGAAMATVIGQFCGAIAGVIVNKRKNKEIPLHFTLRVSGRCMGDILRVGIPTTIMQSVVSCTGILMNAILQTFSSTAIAVMGICLRLQAFTALPVHGIDNALIPIAAYNFGAGKRERIEASARAALGYSALMMSVVVLLLECFPHKVLQLFDASDALLAMGIPALRLMVLAAMLSIPGMVYGTMFQALGRGDYCMVLTLLRQVILPIGLALLFAQTGNLTLIWLAYVLAELLSIPPALALMRQVRWKILDHLTPKENEAVA